MEGVIILEDSVAVAVEQGRVMLQDQVAVVDFLVEEREPHAVFPKAVAAGHSVILTLF